MNNKSKDRLFEMMRKVNRLNEDVFRGNDKQKIINDFVEYVKNEIGLDSLPEIELINKDGAAVEMRSFGGYSPSEKKIVTVISNRNTADVLRTIGHELVHHKQNIENRLKSNSGDTGSDEENEANSIAGVLLRNYGKMNSNIYD